MAREALLGEELAKALRAVRMVVARGEPLSSKRLLAVGAREALAVIGQVLVAHATRRDHFGALGALGRIRLLVARHAEDLVVLRYEALRADRRCACEAQEAILVELLTFVLHLFHAWLEDLGAFVTPRGESLIVALGTVKSLILGAERLIDERYLADVAEEALLVPVLVLVGEVFRIGAYFLIALFARVGEQRLVALYTIRVLLFEDVARARQRLVAVEAIEVLRVKVLIAVCSSHAVTCCSRVFAVEDQLSYKTIISLFDRFF